MVLRIITKKELRTIVPLCSQQIHRLEKQGKFPRRIRLSARRVGWRLSDIETWIEERANDPAISEPHSFGLPLPQLRRKR